MLDYIVNALQQMKKERNKSIEINQRLERCGRPTNPKGEAKRKNNPVVRGENYPENPGGQTGKPNTIEKEATKIYEAGRQE